MYCEVSGLIGEQTEAVGGGYATRLRVDLCQHATLRYRLWELFVYEKVELFQWLELIDIDFLLQRLQSLQQHRLHLHEWCRGTLVDEHVNNCPTVGQGVRAGL